MNPTAETTRTPLIARVCSGLVNCGLGAVLVLSLAFILPSLLGYERYVITGGSMSGTFEKGSVAFEKMVPVADLQVGDVITYLPPADSGLSTLVTHRIVGIKTSEAGDLVFRTQGDANPDPDPWRFQLSAAEQPKVEFTVPAIGYVFLALADRETRMMLIGIPAGLVALSSLAQVARALRERKSTSPGGAEGAGRAGAMGSDSLRPVGA